MLHRTKQKGAGALGTLIAVAVIAYGVYFAIQAVPQYLESSQVDSILQTVADIHHKKPLKDAGEVKSAIDAQLYINQMQGLKDAFSVTRRNDAWVVNARYERELNLLFTKQQKVYEKTLVLESPAS
jgi:hypothetical protein